MTALTYVADAIDRVEGMLKTLAADLPEGGARVYDYVETTAKPVFWWISPGNVTPLVKGTGVSEYTWAIPLRYVIGSSTGGVVGAYQRSLWTAIPTTLELFAQYPALAYEAGQAVPTYLVPARTRIELATPFGDFDGSPFVGAEFTLTLTFIRIVQPLYSGHIIT